MKRNISLILLLAMLLCCVPLSSKAAPVLSGNIETIEDNTFLLGDVNADGEITATDYILVKKVFLREYTFVSSEKSRADMDIDGIITDTDYLKIKTLFLKNPSYYYDYSTTGTTPITKGEAPEKMPSSILVDVDIDKGIYTKPQLDPALEPTSEFDHNPYPTDNTYKTPAYSLDPYTQIYVPVCVNYSPPKTITAKDEFGNTFTAFHAHLQPLPTGYYLNVYNSINYRYTVYLDRNNKIVGMTDNKPNKIDNKGKPILNTYDFLQLANEKISQLAPNADFVLESTSTDIAKRIYKYSRYINGLKTIETLEITFDIYGNTVSYLHKNSMAEYNLDNFTADTDESLYYSIIRNRAAAVLSSPDLLCECMTSYNINDYTLTINSIRFFVAANGRMAGSADITLNPANDKALHENHYLDIMFYV
jgi:hypothetical protein